MLGQVLPLGGRASHKPKVLTLISARLITIRTSELTRSHVLLKPDYSNQVTLFTTCLTVTLRSAKDSAGRRPSSTVYEPPPPCYSSFTRPPEMNSITRHPQARTGRHNVISKGAKASCWYTKELELHEAQELVPTLQISVPFYNGWPHLSGYTKPMLSHTTQLLQSCNGPTKTRLPMKHSGQPLF